MPSRIHRLLIDDGLSTRLFTLWSAGVALCLLGWTGGYGLLPEATLRGLFPAPAIAPDDRGLAATASWLLRPILLGACRESLRLLPGRL